MAMQASPQTWTIRFKNHRTTVLLHVDPLQSLWTVKAELLRAVQQTHPDDQQLNGVPIPSSPADVLLAVLRDINDVSAGWKSIEIPRGTAFDPEDGRKGKGKVPVLSSEDGKKKKKDAVSDSFMKALPQGSGLRDGGIMAFKFRTEDERGRQEQMESDDDYDEIKAEDADEEDEHEEWDVVVPTMEETYGEG